IRQRLKGQLFRGPASAAPSIQVLLLADAESDLRDRPQIVGAVKRKKGVTASRRHLSREGRLAPEEEAVVQPHLQRTLAGRCANAQRDRLISERQIRKEKKLVACMRGNDSRRSAALSSLCVGKWGGALLGEPGFLRQTLRARPIVELVAQI